MIPQAVILDPERALDTEEVVDIFLPMTARAPRLMVSWALAHAPLISIAGIGIAILLNTRSSIDSSLLMRKLRKNSDTKVALPYGIRRQERELKFA